MSDQTSSQQEQQQQHESISSTATSIALIKLNDNQSTKQKQLQKLDQKQPKEKQLQLNAMISVGEQIEEVNMAHRQQQPAAAEEQANPAAAAAINKENLEREDEDFQMVEMVGSPPATQRDNNKTAAADESQTRRPEMAAAAKQSSNNSTLREQLLPSYNASSNIGGGGDLLIEMIINLRNENQNLVRALETNSEQVRERLDEFERLQEEAKRREREFSLEKAEREHEARKLKRQNGVLSERLKSLEAKLSGMRLEVGESLPDAASSSKANPAAAHGGQQSALYPNLQGDNDGSFGNQATMLIDATSGELLNSDDDQQQPRQDVGSRAPLQPSQAGMSKEQLSEHFEASRRQFNALAGDPMRQCDHLERQLEEIGDCDGICSLRRQLNIYRQDFRLERMDKLEASIQIERLKNDIDRLCLARLRGANDERAAAVRFSTASGVRVNSKLNHYMGKKAARAAARAAKHAAKQARREHRANAASTAAKTLAAPAAAPPAGGSNHRHHNQAAADQSEANSNELHDCYYRRRHHHHHHRRALNYARQHLPAVADSIRRSEVVNDLLQTANKAMLTGYKMASTGVNLALDKLSEFEQQQAANLAAKTSQQHLK